MLGLSGELATVSYVKYSLSWNESAASDWFMCCGFSETHSCVAPGTRDLSGHGDRFSQARGMILAKGVSD